MPTYGGSHGVVKIGYRFSQNEGYIQTFIEEGVPSYIQGRILSYSNNGYRVSQTGSGPYWRLQAERPAPVQGINFMERWEIRSEMLEKDLFSLPAAQQEADTYPSGRADYRRNIEETAKGNQTVVEGDLESYPFALKLIQELVRGVTSYETEYTILSRERTEPGPQAAAATLPVQLANARYIYTTAQLQALYNIPLDVMFTLPTVPSSFDPVSEINTMYGWRVREQEASISEDYNVTTTEAFAFAQWSTFLYTAA